MPAAIVIAAASVIGLTAAVIAQRRLSTRDIGRETAGSPPPSPERDPQRQEWDDAWLKEPMRRMAELPKIELGWTHPPLDSPLVSATISGVPMKYRDRHGLTAGTCPVCGLPAAGEGSVPAVLHPTLENGLSIGVGVRAHILCFQACPETDLPRKIPW